MPGALGHQVITALADLGRAVALTLSPGPGPNLAEVTAVARSAHAGSYAASSNPSILAHLSFPDSHKVSQSVGQSREGRKHISSSGDVVWYGEHLVLDAVDCPCVHPAGMLSDGLF
jgi:hypothetical protein